MELIRSFGALGKNDAGLAGGKGASLGEMTQAGVPVPPGFVVLSTSFEQFLKETDLLQEIDAVLGTVNVQEMHTVEHASEKIQALILNAQMPKDIRSGILQNYRTLNAEFVAVRSSATAEDSASAAWAGQLDSYLNTTEKELLKNVQRCWASLFTPRAIFYRFEKELHLTKISVAVVVQKMVASEVSGIAFSVHPVTEDRNQLIIEAGFGLGEAIVSGQVTPDSYVVEKNPRKIIDVNVSTQTRALYRAAGGGNEWRDIAEPKASSQVLTERQILELSELIVKIENHYGFPCDIEWAFEAGKFYIVQSRPITTLSKMQQGSFDIIEKLKQYPLEKYNAFNSIPVVYYEAAIPGMYMNAPIPFERGTPAALGFLIDNKFESWTDRSRLEYIKDPSTIGRIIKENQLLIETLAPKFAAYIADTRARKSAQSLADDLLTLNDYLRYAYKWFGYLLDERIETKDESFLKSLPELRLAVAEEVMILWRCYDKFFKDVAELTGVSISRLGYATSEELLAFLKDGGNTFQVEEGRPIAHVVVDNAIEVYVGDEAVAIHKYLLGKDSRKELATSSLNSGILEGSSTYRGRTRGIVVVMTEKDYPNFKEILKEKTNFILVTPMTRPEIVPYMKKALGIITDEGGITCHAAIVSRELKVPCIVGTKVATQLLKTGDVVEVDAEKGIVTILKRA